MKRQGIILCITITALIGSMFCTGCTGKDTEPAQTAASVPAATEEGNRIITEGMLSPQIIPDEFTSKVLDEKSLQKLQKDLGAETIYDCSYKAADDIYEISSVDSYDKSIIVFMKDGEKGWELKKESVLQISFYMDGEFAGQPMGVGLIHDMKYDDPIVCEGISNDGDAYYNVEITIDEDGMYFSYIFTMSGKPGVVKLFAAAEK